MLIKIPIVSKNDKSNKSSESMTNDSIVTTTPSSWASNGENVDNFPILGGRRKRAETSIDNSQDELPALKTVLDIGLCDTETKLKIETTTKSKPTTTTTMKKASSTAKSFDNFFFSFILFSFLAS